MLRTGVGLVLTLCGLAAVLLALLYANQRSLIYLPARLDPARFAQLVRASLGERATILAPFDAVVVEPPATVPARATVILFHGNAGLGIERSYLVPVCATRGLRLVLAEYPGYGGRAGEPSERALVADGEALYAEVLRRYRGAPVLLAGESLGTGVAVQVATGREPPPARLVLLTPFLSLAETAARAYPYLPARYLVRDRFDSAGRLPRYRGPVAILVAGEDEVVGAAQGRALVALARARGETAYVELPDGGHNGWTAFASDAQWTELLGAPPLATGR